MRGLHGVERPGPIGGAIMLVLGAAILVLAFGPRHDETPALIVIVIVVALICTRALRTRGDRQLARAATASELDEDRRNGERGPDRPETEDAAPCER